MKTTLHKYSFDLRVPAEKAAYEKLCAELLATPGRGRCLAAWADPKGSEPPEGGITLETEHLFSNQWNSTTHRVFDWYEGLIRGNKSLKRGHYLDITDEMRAIRRHTLKCGYTGQQFPDSSGMVFNTTEQALGSEYLEEKDFPLLRLMPVDKEDAERPPLTAEEKAMLLPLYIQAQTISKTSRAGKKRERDIADTKREYEDRHKQCEKINRDADTEYNGKMWLLTRGLSIDNVIHYSHTDRWCFGWRKPIGPELETLKASLEGFPFEYDIKQAEQAKV